MLTDGRTTDAGVTGILIAHLGAFGSGELKTSVKQQHISITTLNTVQKTPTKLNIKHTKTTTTKQVPELLSPVLEVLSWKHHTWVRVDWKGKTDFHIHIIKPPVVGLARNK